MSDPASRTFAILRVAGGSAAAADDQVACEEPLDVRLGGAPFVVTMRTPGDDAALVAGLLAAEGIVRHAAEIAAIRGCTDDRGQETPNVLNVWLQGEAVARSAVALARRRVVTVTSACGVCGRQTIDDLLREWPPLPETLSVSAEALALLPVRLRGAQPAFAATGGQHAAALFDAAGRLQAIAEDVGRHNAVDKVVGARLLAGRLPIDDALLFVSGRTSFEIVQKAAVAGLQMVASVSAPSSLAVDLARAAGITLVGFVRDGGCNVYSAPGRLRVG